MGNSDVVKNEEVSFMKKIVNVLKDLETLRIRTIVGKLKYVAKDKTYVHEDNEQVEAIISEIHLASGDIDTKVTPKFVEEYSALREYHQLKEVKGQEIVNKNLELIKHIADTIIDLIRKDEPENQ